MSDKRPEANSNYDPRPFSDARLREEYSREDVERWRQEADESHANWFDVMNNDYGKD